MSETNEIARLAKVIDYPEAVPSGAQSFVFVVDGRKVDALVRGGRLIVSCVVATRPESAPFLASLAAGRMMREDAVLAWDAEEEAVVLWSGLESKAGAGERGLKQFFETYLNSLDWWMDRVENADSDSNVTDRRAREMRIMP